MLAGYGSANVSGQVTAAMSNLTMHRSDGQSDERPLADEALRTERSRLQDFIDSSVNTFWEIDADLRFTFYSDRDSGDGGAGPSAFVLGRTVLELLGDEATREPWASHIADLMARRPFRNFCYTTDLSEGVRHLSSSGRPFFDASGAFLGYRGVTHDITELEEARRANAWNANHDALTGLSNRRHWNASLEAMFAERSPRGALLLLDLDRFKVVNDTLGHAVGDGLLRHVADVLRGAVREGDVVARLGGDEFAILLRGRVTRSQAASVAKRVLADLERAVPIEGLTVRASTSIGIIMRDAYKGGPAGFVSLADRALYAAKEAGRETYTFHEPDRLAA